MNAQGASPAAWVSVELCCLHTGVQLCSSTCDSVYQHISDTAVTLMFPQQCTWDGRKLQSTKNTIQEPWTSSKACHVYKTIAGSSGWGRRMFGNGQKDLQCHQEFLLQADYQTQEGQTDNSAGIPMGLFMPSIVKTLHCLFGVSLPKHSQAQNL